MKGPWFGKNLRLETIAAAVVGLDDINYAYGYGVYETLKVRHGILYFADLHVERLFHSAAMIGLAHGYAHGAVRAHLEELVAANGQADANLKILLVGRSDDGGGAGAGAGGELGADLYVLELNPLFPKRNDYRDGARAVIFQGERVYPQAKTLNMLVSTMAYRQARGQGAYDALLMDRHGNLTEGTRTNLFWTDGTVLYTPPAEQVLSGVTRLTVMEALGQLGVEIREEPCRWSAMAPGLSWFLTSTSTKIMPLHWIDDRELPVHPVLKQWMAAYDAWLDAWAAGQPVLVKA